MSSSKSSLSTNRSNSSGILLKLNAFSRQCLESGELEPAFKLLKKCESKLAAKQRVQTEMLSATLNNLGMYYRMKGKPLIAVRYLQRALEHELQDPSTSLTRVAETKLNICAVLSQLGKHDLAKDFAQGAIQNLTEDAG